MSRYIKVEGYSSLVRDVKSNGIVNNNVNEYEIYMKRVREREKQSNSMKNMCREINTLKAELREIKDLI